MTAASSAATGPPRNSLSCIAFSPSKLSEIVGLGCGNKDAGSLSQVAYLGSYLGALDAASIVVESRYVDRQYVEEYATYYSRCMQPIPHHCQRLHFFSAALNRGALRDLLERAAADELETVERELKEAYLGFIVVRPLPAAPVGRTVLRSYLETGKRRYPHTVRYPVHLCGLTLQVEGIAFQQSRIKPSPHARPQRSGRRCNASAATRACAPLLLRRSLQRPCATGLRTGGPFPRLACAQSR